jgi:hypothetical protein
MKIFGTIREAIAGWVAIVRGDAGWSRHFTLSAAGLVTALVLFFFFALLSIALASANVGLPDVIGLVIALLVQSISILALIAGIILTRRAVPTPASMTEILVPGIYALTAYLIAGTLLSFIAGPALIALWAGLAFLLLCLGRRVGGWNIGVAAAFAVLTMVLLVGLPVTLYMLLGPVAAPTP